MRCLRSMQTVGTLQFHGLRVALGILLFPDVDVSPDTPEAMGGSSEGAVPRRQDLTPNDLVALVTTLVQLSKSVDQVRIWTTKSTTKEMASFQVFFAVVSLLCAWWVFPRRLIVKTREHSQK